MSNYIIEGGKKLYGETYVSGSKNASLPIMAASVLNRGITKLYNVPNIHDTQMMVEILKNIGCKVKKNQNKIVIDSRNVNKFEIPEHLMRQMRSSVIFAGAILGRYKKVTFSYPGRMWYRFKTNRPSFKRFWKIRDNSKSKFWENNMWNRKNNTIRNKSWLSKCRSNRKYNAFGRIIWWRDKNNKCRNEPEIVDLQNFLNKMGAKIDGAGSNIIKIKGVKNLKDVSYNVMPDRIEAGTLLCAAAITGGEITLKKVNASHITPVLNKLAEAGCTIKLRENEITLKAPKKLKAVDIKTMPYPGFPTDMQAIMGATLTVATGTSIIVENIFESRYKYMIELQKMGAKINIEGKTAIIKGVKKLYGAKVQATDLRGGASLVLAGLVAKGTTNVENIEYILRGYENLDGKLKNLGAEIYMIK